MSMSMKRSPAKVILIAMILGATLTALPAVGSHEHTSRVSPPRPLLSVAAEGDVTVGGSYAVVRMTYTCPEEADLFIEGDLRQDNIVVTTQAGRYRAFACEGTAVTEDLIFNAYSPTRLRPGKALVQLTGRICINNEIYAGCRWAYRDKFVQLEIPGAPLDLPL